MPKRIPFIDRDTLRQVPLPTWAKSYTVIPHETVIINSVEHLKLRGFTVESEEYRASNSGDVATGVYRLTYQGDPELGMMFAWANSYDKSMRFKCAVGGFVKSNNAVIIGDDFSWSRKHTGTADQEMVSQVNNQVINAQMYYDNLVAVKEAMKKIIINPKEIAEFLGRAFFLKNLFNKEQIGIIRENIEEEKGPNAMSTLYNADKNSLWVNYNHMLVALRRSHPRTWMDEQLNLHKEICAEFKVRSTTVQPSVVVQQPAVVPVQPVAVSATPDVKATPAAINEFFGSVSEEEIAPVKEAMADLDAEHVGLKEEKVEETPVAELKPDNSIPFLDDINAEEQKLIDERIAKMFGSNSTPADLTLPD